jgi:DNA-binding NarL/FixJ family response regulator
MNETVLMIGGLAVVLFIVVLYMAVRDKETSRKLAMLEAGIDGVNRETFKIAKELERLRKEVHEEMLRFELEQRQEHEPSEQLLNKKLQPFVLRIQQLQERVDAMSEELQGRLEELDGKVRRVTFAADHAAPDEQKILQLHAQGLDSDTIAKQLRLGKGEVELVLKFSKIHA